MGDEKWMQIVGGEGIYEVSATGKARSRHVPGARGRLPQAAAHRAVGGPRVGAALPGRAGPLRAAPGAAADGRGEAEDGVAELVSRVQKNLRFKCPNWAAKFRVDAPPMLEDAGGAG